MQRRLTIVIHSLDGGGAERTAARMANDWAEAGHSVTLITLDSADSDRYGLMPAVDRQALDVMGHSSNPLAALRNNFRRISVLRRAIAAAGPQRVISLTDKTNVLTLAACRKLDVPVIVAERTDPRYHQIGRVWSYLRQRLYPRATALVVQTDSVRNALRPMMAGRPIYVIPNLVENKGTSLISAEQRAPSENQSDLSDKSVMFPFPPDRKRVVGMGRLTREKGFDLLVRAFAETARRRPSWDLVIFGEGAERGLLERLAAESGLAERVFLPGWSDDPSKALKAADLFVLPSRYEGFPNALLEAMAAGLPAISFDCPSGPYEIIRDGYDGLLVRAESAEWLAAAMDRLMRDSNARRLLAEKAPEVLQRFTPERYYARWEAVLDGRPEHDPVFGDAS
jgi:glycosyltransferase involved in cell wall biosynthesis